MSEIKVRKKVIMHLERVKCLFMVRSDYEHYVNPLTAKVFN